MNADRYTIISADGHAGGSAEQYRTYLDSSLLDQFDAWRGRYQNDGQTEPMSDHLETIGAAINQLQRLLSSRRVFSRLATSAGLTLSQQSTQVLLAMTSTPRPIADVAATANMDVGAVSRQLKILEDEGLAKRAASPSHGRIVLVRRTAKGERLGEHVREVRSRHLISALSTWTPVEREQFGILLTRLVSDLQTTPYQNI